MKRTINLTGLIFVILLWSCETEKPVYDTKLWYDKPASNWGEAFPIGNGRLAAMNYGGIEKERFQLNEESLWAGSQTNPYAQNYRENLTQIQEMVLKGDYAKAHDFGVENLTARPTSFRSYEPLADLLIEFEGQGEILGYKRKLDLSTGISKVNYHYGETQVEREAFISAVDDVLCIRVSFSGNEKINATIGLERFEGAEVNALPEGELLLKGQVIDIEAPEGYDDNPGGSGPGGKHMRFAGHLSAKVDKGTLESDQNKLEVRNAGEVIILFTAATDYNLPILNFDRSLDPGEKSDMILKKAKSKTWEQLKADHVKEHSEMFNRVSLHLEPSPNDTLPTDRRIEAFKNGAKDQGLVVQLFQFGRYLLMGSSRGPAVLPANLQGKWNEREWAPWEADYHLNVNLQMNYWPSDVTNLGETNKPLINWFEQMAKNSQPLAREMFDANGWFSCLATSPFGRVTPSASNPQSQFINGVLDPLAGAWMVMNLWDHYEYSQDKTLLEERIFPLLMGASEFILDMLITDNNGTLHFVPSTSPETGYIDPETRRNLRITASSTYHISVIHAVFEATLEASDLLEANDPIYEKIQQAQKLLPAYPISKNGRITDWQTDFEEGDPGHRHLSHLLGVHPFGLITPENPELFRAARKSLDWRKANGQGEGVGWSAAHSAIMYAWFLDGKNAKDELETLLHSFEGTLLNAQRIFQIDANFGATSAVAEMLVQSHQKDDDGNVIIHLLPAIPSEWSTGSVKGLCTRGGFTVDLEWEESKIKTAYVTAKNSGSCKIRFKDKTIDLILDVGEKRKLTDF